jgi:hypothetical protein
MAKFLSIPIQGRSSLNYLQTSYNLRVSAQQLLRLFSSFFVVNVYQTKNILKRFVNATPVLFYHGEEN